METASKLQASGLVFPMLTDIWGPALQRDCFQRLWLAID